MTAAETARASRAAQGLPPKVEDAAALARIAHLIAVPTLGNEGVRHAA